MNETPVMTYVLIIGLVVAFGVGVYVGRAEQPPSLFPSNYDAVGVAVEAKASKVQVATCYELLQKQLVAAAEERAACKKAEVAH